MKKILLGTSALAMAGAFAGQANAATWDLDWGGYYETSVVYRSGDGLENRVGGDDNEGIDVIQDGEIQFTPSITLDNGLTFGVDVQLEADSQASADIIDESYVFVSGSFGRIQLGSENSASYAMAYGAPDVTWIGVNSGSLSGILGLSGGGRSFNDFGNGNDPSRITYYTPRFSGFQVGVSYAHDGSEDKQASNGVAVNAAGTAGTGLTDIFGIGANYVNSFGAFDVAASVTYTTATANSYNIVTGASSSADPDAFAVGLNLGYAGFGIGGSYSQTDDDAGSETDFFDLGVSYKTGPWATSFTYSNTDTDGGIEADQFIAGVNYKLGPGVVAGAYAGYMETEVNGSNDLDGFVIGTGFKLSF